MADDEGIRAAKTRWRLLQTYRSAITEHVPAQLAEAFELVCWNEGKTVFELAELGGATKTTMSRHLLDLSEKLRSGADGYKLLQRVKDPTNMRSVVYSLTPKGRLLRNSLREIMEDYKNGDLPRQD
jgi:DNA-binding MarR family transcriptional regulator